MKDDAKRALVAEIVTRPDVAGLSDRAVHERFGTKLGFARYLVGAVRRELAAAGRIDPETLPATSRRKRMPGAGWRKGYRLNLAGSMVPAVAADALDSIEYGRVYMRPTGTLRVDPDRFQFRTGTRTGGITGELLGVTVFNENLAGVLLAWREPADGKDYVVNGHHRHELAARTGHPTLAVRFVRAKDHRAARAVGALANIAEGRGSSTDAATFIRDHGVGVEDLARFGVSLTGPVAEQALALARLSDRAFAKVARGELDPAKAAAVGRHLADHARQDQLFRFLAGRRSLALTVVEQMAKRVNESPTFRSVQPSLFGDLEDEESTFLARCELAAFVRADLARDRGDFLAVASARRASRVAGAGNVLNVDANRELAGAAALALEVFDRLANRTGAIAHALTDTAWKYATAGDRAERERWKAEAVRWVRGEIVCELRCRTNNAGVSHAIE